MDNYVQEQSKHILFSEYALAGGMRTQYVLKFVTPGGSPALWHQLRDADDEARSKTVIEACAAPVDVQAGEPEPSVLMRLAEDAKG
jgi:hypothetical protein